MKPADIQNAILYKLIECEQRLLANNPELTVPEHDKRHYRVRFDVKGRCAGKAARDGSYVNFNMVIAEDNFDDFLARTVPHEFAHIVAALSYGEHVQPHGREWKRTMRMLGAPDDRCHSYDTTRATSRTVARQHAYKCGCRTHNLTSIRHNRVVRGQQTYFCRSCRTKLEKV